MAEIQQQYDDLIRHRDPDKVRDLWQQTGIAPDETNLKLILEVGKRVQECIDIRSGRCVEPKTPPEIKHWNLYVDIRGIGSREAEED